MPKTQQEWRDVDSWSVDRAIARIGMIAAEIECVVVSDVRLPIEGVLADLADEAIVLMLNTLKLVVEEKRWLEVRPLGLFEGAYGDLSTTTTGKVIMGRFLDTKRVVEAYREGAGKTKSELKNKLIERGFI